MSMLDDVTNKQVWMVGAVLVGITLIPAFKSGSLAVMTSALNPLERINPSGIDRSKNSASNYDELNKHKAQVTKAEVDKALAELTIQHQMQVHAKTDANSDVGQQVTDLTNKETSQEINKQKTIQDLNQQTETAINNAMQGYQDKIASLTTQVSDSNEGVNQAKSDASEQMQRVTRDYINHVNVITTQYNDSQGNIQDLKNQIKQAQKDYQNKLDDITNQYQNEEGITAGIQKEIEEVKQAGQNTLNQIIEKYTEQISSLQGKADSQKQTADKNISDLNNHKDQTNEQNDKDIQKQAEMQALIDKLSKILTGLQQDKVEQDQNYLNLTNKNLLNRLNTDRGNIQQKMNQDSSVINEGNDLLRLNSGLASKLNSVSADCQNDINNMQGLIKQVQAVQDKINLVSEGKTEGIYLNGLKYDIDSVTDDINKFNAQINGDHDEVMNLIRLINQHELQIHDFINIKNTKDQVNYDNNNWDNSSDDTKTNIANHDMPDLTPAHKDDVAKNDWHKLDPEAQQDYAKDNFDKLPHDEREQYADDNYDKMSDHDKSLVDKKQYLNYDFYGYYPVRYNQTTTNTIYTTQSEYVQTGSHPDNTTIFSTSTDSVVHHKDHSDYTVTITVGFSSNGQTVGSFTGTGWSYTAAEQNAETFWLSNAEPPGDDWASIAPQIPDYGYEDVTVPTTVTSDTDTNDYYNISIASPQGFLINGLDDGGMGNWFHNQNQAQFHINYQRMNNVSGNGYHYRVQLVRTNYKGTTDKPDLFMYINKQLYNNQSNESQSRKPS